jgi:small-conductance mechanosensitive channel
MLKLSRFRRVRERAVATCRELLATMPAAGLVLVLATAPYAAGQSGGGSGAPKMPANPLAALLKDKSKPQPVEAELPAAIPEQPLAIPLPEVAARSLELSQRLRDAAATLPTREQLDAVQTSIAEIEPTLQTKLDEALSMVSGTPNSLEIREEQNYWQDVSTTAEAWQQQLLNWANSAQNALKMLDAQEPLWQATLSQNKGNHELDPVLSVITDNLSEIRRLRKLAQDALQFSVNLQIRVGAVDSQAMDMLARLNVAQRGLKGHMLDRDSLPLWQMGNRRADGESPSAFRSANSRWISLTAYLRDNRGVVVFLAILLGISLITTWQLRAATRDKKAEDELEASAYRILRHWLALGLLLPMTLAYALMSGAPVTLLGLLILISFYPILIILPPLVNRRFRLLLYAYTTIYALWWSLSWSGLRSAPRREVEFFLTLALFGVFVYLVRPVRQAAETVTGWRRVLLWGIRLSVAGWGVSLVAAFLGYMKLARYLALACLYSTFVAISVFTAWQVLMLLLTVGLRSPLAERVALVRIHRAGIERWGPRALKVLRVLIWLRGTTALLGMTDGLNAAKDRLLNFSITSGAGGATLGGILSLFAILIGGYGIATAVRFLLREEALRRFHMARGLPELISSIIYYLLMVIFTLEAMNAGGIELNKFTVLTGAFGVGIGFGLQNIINNFVSGLILQFERPIHIDDILEVDTNIGKVTRIGVRSSTISTAQGAEVIIPNAILISSKVINWTLSESQRRRELPIGVAYGSDPTRVLKILRDAAAKHELVLSKPEPIAYFTGFGESALNFELHFWVMQENNGLQISSEVALDVMKALNDAGIEVPFPQRDVRLRAVEPGAAGALLRKDKA